MKAVDNKSYEATKKARATMRSGRTELERRRKALKAESVAYGKLVDSNAKQIEEAILEVEEPLAAEIERYEAERDRACLEAEEAERPKDRGRDSRQTRGRGGGTSTLSKSSSATRRVTGRTRRGPEEIDWPAPPRRCATQGTRGRGRLVARPRPTNLNASGAELQSMQDKIDADRRCRDGPEGPQRGRTVGAGTRDREARERRSRLPP